MRDLLAARLRRHGSTSQTARAMSICQRGFMPTAGALTRQRTLTAPVAESTWSVTDPVTTVVAFAPVSVVEVVWSHAPSVQFHSSRLCVRPSVDARAVNAIARLLRG